jgi:hypothetical protein
MDTPRITTEDLLGAIRAGVRDAFRGMYENTDMPTADLYDTIREAVSDAFNVLSERGVQKAIAEGVRGAMEK